MCSSDLVPRGVTIEIQPYGGSVPAGTGLGIAVAPTVLAGPRIGVQFASTPNALYAIEYASKVSTNAADWKRVWPDVFSPGNFVQWIDEGPPKTESAPEKLASRFYRVRFLTLVTNAFPNQVALPPATPIPPADPQ